MIDSKLFRRLKRVLLKDHEVLRKCSSNSHAHDLGDYYATHLFTNVVTRKHIDLEQLAAEVGNVSAERTLEPQAEHAHPEVTIYSRGDNSPFEQWLMKTGFKVERLCSSCMAKAESEDAGL